MLADPPIFTNCYLDPIVSLDSISFTFESDSSSDEEEKNERERFGALGRYKPQYPFYRFP